MTSYYEAAHSNIRRVIADRNSMGRDIPQAQAMFSAANQQVLALVGLTQAVLAVADELRQLREATNRD